MKKPPDVILMDKPKDLRLINLYCLILWAHDAGDKYLLIRAIERLNQLTTNPNI